MTPETFFVTAPQVLILQVNGRILAHAPVAEFNRDMHAKGARKYSAAGIKGVIHVDSLTFNRRSGGADLIVEADEIGRTVANISVAGIRHAMHHIAFNRPKQAYDYEHDAKAIFENGTHTFRRVQDWFKEQRPRTSQLGK